MKIIRCNMCKEELATNEYFLTVSIKTGEPEKGKPNPVTSNAHVCSRCSQSFCKFLSVPPLAPGARKPISEDDE
jgi:hypothetical protein